MQALSILRQRLLPANPLRRFFRGSSPLVPPVRLKRQNIYILPTKAGLGFITMIAVVLIGAMNYQNNLAYLLGFGLISLILVTKIETYRQLLGLEIFIGHIEPVFCGQTLKVPVIVKLKGQQRFSIELSKEFSQHFNDIASPQSLLRINLPADQRGLHSLGLIRITSRFPLGLFYAWTPMPMAINYLVYPKPEANAPSATQFTTPDQQYGDNKTGDDDFAGVKSYHPGDAPKHIHWKAYAKGQGLQSKQYSTSQNIQRHFNWDNTHGLSLEQRLSRLTAWLVNAERQGETFSLHMPHMNIESGHGAHHLHRCLKVLAMYQQAQKDD